MRFSLPQNSWLILGMTLLIGVAFSLYFLVYVPNKEKQLIENNFRILRQIKDNFLAQEKGYKNNVEAINNSQSSLCDPVYNEIQNAIIYGPIKCNKNKQGKIRQAYYESDSVYYSVENDDTGNCNYSDKKIYYAISYEDFFNNDLVKRADIFDYIIFSTYNADNREVLYTNSPGGIVDSVFHTKKLPSYSELNLAAEKYLSFNQHLDNDFYITGLISKTDFNGQKRRVSTFVIIVSSILLVFLVLNVPLIKLKMMNTSERLYAYDVILTSLSLIVGSAIMVLLMFSLVFNFGEERNYQKEKLKSLSGAVEQQFQKDLTNAIHQLNYIEENFPIHNNASILDETLYFSQKQLDTIFGNESNDQSGEFSMNYDLKGFKIYDSVLHESLASIQFEHYKHFNYIFWNTDSAQSLVFLSPFKDPVYVQNLHHRKYLTNVNTNKAITFNDDNGNTFNIGFESIKSVNDGTYEVGIGISTNDTFSPENDDIEENMLPVLAMSTKLVSVMDAVLPDGYAFCILDNEGNTVFHSDIQKNMNENFIEETRGAFRPFILSNTEYTNTVDYGNQRCLVHFKPLNCLQDHYIATYKTKESVNIPYSLAMINAIILFVGYLIVVFLAYLLLYAIMHKSNKLRQSGFMFNWLRPIETPHYNRKYARLSVLNAIVILYLIISSTLLWEMRDLLINNLLLNTIALLLLSCYTLFKDLPVQKKLDSVFQNKSLDLRNRNKFMIIAGVFIALLISNKICLIITECTECTNCPRWLLLLFLANLILIITIFYFCFKEEKADQKPIKENKLILRYHIYLFSWLLIISFIPIHIFFGIAYEQEQEIINRYHLSNTSKNLNEWKSKIDDEFKVNLDSESYYKFFRSMSKDHEKYLKNDKIIQLNNTHEYASIHTTNHYFLALYDLLRPGLNPTVESSEGFLKAESDLYRDDTTNAWTSAILKKDTFNLDKHTLAFSDSENNFTTKYNRFATLYNSPKWSIPIYLAFIAIMLLYFSLIRFTTDHIYGFGYKKIARQYLKSIGDLFRASIQRIGNFNITTNHLFFVSLNSIYDFDKFEKPQTNASTSFITLDCNEIDHSYITAYSDTDSITFTIENKCASIDMENFQKLKAALQDKNVVLYIRHFEYRYNDHNCNKIKCSIIKHFTGYRNVRIVICSAINAQMIDDFYGELINETKRTIRHYNEGEHTGSLNDDLQEYISTKIAWQYIIGQFNEVILPVNFSHTSIDEQESLLRKDISPSYYSIISYPYLSKSLYKNYDPDDTIIKMQHFSYPHYTYIWNTLSKNERYIVYDIANNRFVNTHDANSIIKLLNKGILVYDHSLRLYNESFTNFVLNRIKGDEILEHEVKKRRKGTWNTTFIILLLLIISLVIFLSIGQQNFLDDVSALFTSIGALAGILLRFGGFFSFSKGG